MYLVILNPVSAGPKHVIELSDGLGLSESQRMSAESIYQEMHSKAVDLGRQIIEAEAALDGLFAGADLDPAEVQQFVQEIAYLTGQLRFLHLSGYCQISIP